MFYLWHETYDIKHPKFRVVKYQKALGLQQYGLFKPLNEIINQSFSYPHYQHHFLLDDTRFHFFRFDIFKKVEKAFTIDDLNLLIDERLNYLKEYTEEELLFTHIDNIFVNGEEKKFVIGEKGQIFFRLCFIYLNRDTLLDFNKQYGNVFNQKNIQIRPESFKTVSFLKKKLERDNFLLLYIKESYCKVIAIEDGFYKQIDHINLGINFLMQMYKDNQIVKYRYKNSEEIDQNSLAKSLVVESISFYVDYLCKWLHDLGLTNKDIFIISPIIKNGNFMEIFNKVYSGYHNKYIVPFHYSSHLVDFGKTWDPENMDTLIFLNSSYFKKILLP